MRVLLFAVVLRRSHGLQGSAKVSNTAYAYVKTCHHRDETVAC